jgi:hypothetical protein
MFAREDGLPFDPSALDEQVARAVELVVDRQLKAGLDIINDGEMPKPSYATYVKDRFTGFGGSGNSYVFQDLEAYPGFFRNDFYPNHEEYLFACADALRPRSGHGSAHAVRTPRPERISGAQGTSTWVRASSTRK